MTSEQGIADTLDCVVVGAGVVGLAVARALALAGREVVVLEATEGIGTGTSSRNSEVIHAGIYYPAGSLKARLCVEGRRALYAYVAARGVPHRQCGKLIVATHATQHATLEGIRVKADANGVLGAERLRWLDAGEARALEPEVACTAALLSPSTGIIDSHSLMLALQGDAEHANILRRNSAYCCQIIKRTQGIAQQRQGRCDARASAETLVVKQHDIDATVSQQFGIRQHAGNVARVSHAEQHGLVWDVMLVCAVKLICSVSRNVPASQSFLRCAREENFFVLQACRFRPHEVFHERGHEVATDRVDLNFTNGGFWWFFG